MDLPRVRGGHVAPIEELGLVDQAVAALVRTQAMGAVHGQAELEQLRADNHDELAAARREAAEERAVLRREATEQLTAVLARFDTTPAAPAVDTTTSTPALARRGRSTPAE